MEITAFCFEIQAKHLNALCGQNAEYMNMTPGGM
jgi:hypothetical protein